jgi:hypothetical protein
VPYEDVLDASEIYGIEVLHRAARELHDWFAGVRPGKGTAKLMLLPMQRHPSSSRASRRRSRSASRATRCSRSSR